MRLSEHTRNLAYAVSVVAAVSLLPACAKTVDVFPEVTVYNGTFDAVRVEVYSDGLGSTRFRLRALTSRVIAPGDQCRFTVLEISTLKDAPIDSYEGSVCADDSLVLGEDNTIALEEK